MFIFQCNRFLYAMVCVLGISTFTEAQVSSTEQAVMDKILELKADIDELMMKPGSSSDKAAMDKVFETKKEMDTFLGLLPPHLQEQVKKKMAQSSGGAQEGGDAIDQKIPFIMTQLEVQKVEMALMRSQLIILKRIAGALRQSGTVNPTMQVQWTEFIESVSASGMEADVPSLTKYVMKEAYSEGNKGLEELGSQVRLYRDMRTQLRDEIAKVKNLAAAVQGTTGQLSESIPKKQVSLGLDGKMKLQVRGQVTSKTDALQYLEELEQHLSATNENAEKASLELEEILLKQSPKLKTMSEVAQKLQESGKAAVEH